MTSTHRFPSVTTSMEGPPWWGFGWDWGAEALASDEGTAAAEATAHRREGSWGRLRAAGRAQRVAIRDDGMTAAKCGTK